VNKKHKAQQYADRLSDRQIAVLLDANVNQVKVWTKDIRMSQARMLLRRGRSPAEVARELEMYRDEVEKLLPPQVRGQNKRSRWRLRLKKKLF